MIIEANKIEQGSDEWKLLRRGVPTCSKFGNILPATTLKKSASYEGYLNQLAAESIGLYDDWKGNQHTERGNEYEPEAVFYYEFTNNRNTEVTGFIWKDERKLVGGSPDRLVGLDGGLEVKCPAAKAHIGYLRSGELPSEYRAQVYGYLWLTGRKWWDFISFHPEFTKQFECRLTVDDEAYCEWLEKWEPAIDSFCRKLEIVKGMVAEWYLGA